MFFLKKLQIVLLYFEIQSTFEPSKEAMQRRMHTTSRKKTTGSTLPALIVLGAGLLLLAMKVIGDGEPGALPLFMVITGTVWYFIARRRDK